MAVDDGVDGQNLFGMNTCAGSEYLTWTSLGSGQWPSGTIYVVLGGRRGARKLDSLSSLVYMRLDGLSTQHTSCQSRIIKSPHLRHSRRGRE